LLLREATLRAAASNQANDTKASRFVAGER
jgi:hypothetical protein